MPELKFLRRPARKIMVFDEHGQAVDLAALEGRRIKWARRQGRRILAMIAGPRKGMRGILLHFRCDADYEVSVRRVLKSETVSLSRLEPQQLPFGGKR